MTDTMDTAERDATVDATVDATAAKFDRLVATRRAYERAKGYIAELRRHEPVPLDWKLATEDGYGRGYSERMATRNRPGLLVIESVLPYGPDNDLWYHVSFSRVGRMPTYDDIQRVRRAFVGEHRECYQIFPPRERYVSVHPYCLHLWYCIDRPDGVLPDMRIDGTV